MQLESEIRINGGQRADRFVTEWRQLRSRRERLSGWQTEAARTQIDNRMEAVGKALARDPQLESLLHSRRIELGLKPSSGASLSHDIQNYLGLSRGRGIGM